jgi:hypothetical protein
VGNLAPDNKILCFDHEVSSFGLGRIAHAYNPSYLRDGDREGYCLKPIPAKSNQDSISVNNSGMMVHTCDPRYAKDRRIEAQGWFRTKT